jgi:hypothetical protein
VTGDQLVNPGVGEYKLRKEAAENTGPQWRFGATGRTELKRNDFPGPTDTNVK